MTGNRGFLQLKCHQFYNSAQSTVLINGCSENPRCINCSFYIFYSDITERLPRCTLQFLLCALSHHPPLKNASMMEINVSTFWKLCQFNFPFMPVFHFPYFIALSLAAILAASTSFSRRFLHLHFPTSICRAYERSSYEFHFIYFSGLRTFHVSPLSLLLNAERSAQRAQHATNCITDYTRSTSSIWTETQTVSRLVFAIKIQCSPSLSVYLLCAFIVGGICWAGDSGWNVIVHSVYSLILAHTQLRMAKQRRQESWVECSPIAFEWPKQIWNWTA